MTEIIRVKDVPEYIERAIVRSDELAANRKNWEKRYAASNRVGSTRVMYPVQYSDVSFETEARFVKATEKLGYRVVDIEMPDSEAPDSNRAMLVEAAPGNLPVLNLAALAHDYGLDKRPISRIADEYRAQNLTNPK